MSTLTEKQKRTIDILRAQGETDDRIADYLGITIPEKSEPEPERELEREPVRTLKQRSKYDGKRR